MLCSMVDGDNDSLPDLDYAFLAEFARVDAQGTLTSVGASFTRVTVPVPGSMPMGVGGRLRLAEDSEPVQLDLHYSGPSERTPRLEASMLVSVGESIPYEGRVGVLFAVNLTLPVVEEGLQRIDVLLNGVRVRSLMFSATAA